MKQKEFVVGLFATAGLVLLYFGWYFLKGIDFFNKTSKYYAVYENVDNLAVSNPVRVSGFEIGRVSAITILPEKNHIVVVELDIDSKIKLSDSTRAILDSELLGSKFILLEIGDPRRPLKPGDTIQAELAKGMFAKLTESAEPVASNLQTTLAKFGMVIDNLARNSQSLDSIFRKLQKTPDLLNATIGNANNRISEVSVSVTEMSGNLNQTLTELKPTLKNMAVLTDSLKRLQLNGTLLKTQQTLASLQQTLAKLNKGDNTASKLLTEDSLYNNLNRLLVRMDSLVSHINNYPKHFTAPLGKSRKKVLRDLQKEKESTPAKKP